MNGRIKLLAEREADRRKHIVDLTDTPIKDLAVSSGIYDCITDPYDKLGNGDSYSSVMPDLVRFAELIIRQCADLADFADKNPGDYVRKHFGVEVAIKIS